MTSAPHSSIDTYESGEGIKVVVTLARHDLDRLVEHGEVVVHTGDEADDDSPLAEVTIQRAEP